MGGYCFINNAAVAAQWLLEQGAKRVSILDVDYHHGNGTQEIFYRRADVQVINFHADPMQEYPYFLGHADEKGAAAGEGATLNLPLPHGTTLAPYRAALATGLAAIRASEADLLVLSFGADTYVGDPIAHFALETADYAIIAEDIAAVGLPTLIVMEGGYAVDALGANLASLLSRFPA